MGLIQWVDVRVDGRVDVDTIVTVVDVVVVVISLVCLGGLEYRPCLVFIQQCRWTLLAAPLEKHRG